MGFDWVRVDCAIAPPKLIILLLRLDCTPQPAAAPLHTPTEKSGNGDRGTETAEQSEGYEKANMYDNQTNTAA